MFDLFTLKIWHTCNAMMHIALQSTIQGIYKLEYMTKYHYLQQLITLFEIVSKLYFWDDYHIILYYIYVYNVYITELHII